jgi:hypothetical protein
MTEKEYHKIALQNLKPYIVDDDDVRRRSYRIDGKLVWAVAGRCEFNDELILATVDRVTEPYNKKGLFGKVTSFFGGADSEFQKRRAETCKKELGELKYPSEFVEVYGEGRPVQGAYYDKNTKSEMITIEVSNLRIKVKWKNMKYLRKWVLEARTRENKLITNAIEDLYGIDRKKKLGIILVVGYGSGRDERVWKLRPIDEPDFRIKHDCGIVEDQELPKKLTFAVPMKVYKQKYVLSELSIDFF